MPRVDNEWGEWDPSQWDVPPRGTWFPGNLKGSPELQPISKETLDTNSSATPVFQSLKELNTSRNNPIEIKKAILKPQPKRCSEEFSLCLKTFREWYVWARETERHELYLENITDLALEFKNKTPEAEKDENALNSQFLVSAANLHNMKLDKKNYYKLLERFLENAKIIVLNQGKTEMQERERFLQCASEDGQYLLIYKPSLKSTTVYKNSRLIAYHQQVTFDNGANYTIQFDKGEKFVRKDDMIAFWEAANAIKSISYQDK